MVESKTRKRSWLRKAAANLAVALFGILMGLLVIELGLRLVLAAEPTALNAGSYNPWKMYVGWAPNPYQVRISHGAHFPDVRIAYNSRGLRDVEHAVERPAGTFRILFLGDSFLEAAQVDLSQTFHRILEERLNSAGLPMQIECIAAGVSGWGTDQEVLYYENEGYRYDADLVVLMFTVNDVTDNWIPMWERSYNWNPRRVPPKPYFTLDQGALVLNNFPYSNVVQPGGQGFAAAHNWLYVHLYTYRLLIDLLQTHLPRLQTALETRLGVPPAEQLAWTTEPGDSVAIALGLDSPQLYVYSRDYPDDEYRQAWELTNRLVERLQADVEANGARLAVVSNTSAYATVPQDYAAMLASDPRTSGLAWDWNLPGERMGAIAAGRGIPFFDLQPIFAARAPSAGPLHIPDDGHWTPEAHQLVADSLFEWLMESCLVPCR